MTNKLRQGISVLGDCLFEHNADVNIELMEEEA
jgi:hypothetical protein